MPGKTNRIPAPPPHVGGTLIFVNTLVSESAGLAGPGRIMKQTASEVRGKAEILLETDKNFTAYTQANQH